MTAAAHDFSEFRFSSAALPERDRLAFCREEFGRKMSRCEMEPLGGSFHFGMKLRVASSFTLIKTDHSPLRIRRTPELLTDGDDSLVLGIATHKARASQLGREIETEPGDAMLGSNGDLGTFTYPSADSKCILLSLSRERLQPLLKDFDSALVRRIPARTQALEMLTRYIHILDQMPSLSPELQQLSATHLYDLAAMTFGATKDASENAERSVRAARLAAIKYDVLASLSRRDLSAETIGKAHGVTASYIRKLFASEEISFTDFVLEQRLLFAYRRLNDPRFADRSISALAFDAGFGDLSYFNRAFRRRFGMTPSDVRANRT